MTNDLPMTRARLFILINAFEHDIRSHLQKYVIDEIGEEAGLGSFYEGCIARRDSDPSIGEAPLCQYLDMRDSYDLLNTHRGRLPSDLANEVRELTQNLDRLVGIRNRVMHARPLVAGDSDAAVSLSRQYQTPYWAELRRTLAQLHADPAWEPSIGTTKDESPTLHNLPLPDYDDTGLIGRGKEVSELVKLLKRGREPVITITGEGGIGKTALAVEVAYRLIDDADVPFDAVLWSSLKFEKLTAYGVREISGSARELVGAIRPAGIALDPGFGGSLSELSDLLDGFKVLLILDNLETVSGDEFKSLYEILPDTVTFLLTSRLGVGEYERRYALETLSNKDSLQLFNQFVRARNIASLSRLTSETRIRVVHELRCSPLAIKWFALAVEAGNDPLDLIRRQDDLLEFCVRSVYSDLSRPAQEVLVALSVLARPLTADELVVLLDHPTDEISGGLKELMRGSLVRRESTGVGEDLLFQIVLTDTATQFLSRRVQPDEKLQRQLKTRDREFREIQERRANDVAARSLAPVVVRQRTENDAPTCTLLRHALLSAKKGDDSAIVYEKIDQARRMNPDFWEVDRVEGFIRGGHGDLAAATACYERAYANAAGEDRAVVAHFFAGHLARKIRDVSRAIEFAREAHDLLDLPDTAVALGNYLIWTHQFEPGIDLLESVVPNSSSKARVIAVSALAEAWRRYAEAVGDEGRNYLDQFRYAQKGFEISSTAFESGIADERLRSTAADCAALAVRAATICVRAEIKVPDLPDFLGDLETVVVRFVGTRAWPVLTNEIEKLGRSRGAPASAKRLLEATGNLAVGSSLDDSTDVLIGEVVHVSGTFGFIRHPKYPENVFFHGGSIVDNLGMQTFKPGMLVRFIPEVVERGPRATQVQPA